MSVIHKCEKCKYETKEDADCFCNECVEEIKQEAFDEGYKTAKEELEEKIG